MGPKDDDDYFTCITKAFEVLGVPHKRRAYDSVDPTIDDDVPAEFGKNSKKDFFQVSKQRFYYFKPSETFSY